MTAGAPATDGPVGAPAPRDLTLALTSRALRLVFVVRDRAEVMDAVTLCTHVPGGQTWTMLPAPTNDAEVGAFVRAARRCDPDYVVAFAEQVEANAVDAHLARAIEGLPCAARLVTRQEITEHVEGPNRLRWDGVMPHQAVVLRDRYPTAVPQSNIRVVEAGGPHEALIQLHHGRPAAWYTEHLLSHLGAKRLRAPDDLQDLVRTLLVGAARLTPLELTAAGLRRQPGSLTTSELIDGSLLGGPHMLNSRTLFLFLDAEADLGTVAAFWNARRFHEGATRLLLPRAEVLATLPGTLRTLHDGLQFDAVAVFLRAGEVEAREIHATFVAALAAVAPGCPVQVQYGAYAYALTLGGACAGAVQTVTRTTAGDGGVHFAPAPPPGCEAEGTAFGFDARLTFADGAVLPWPATPLTSALLTNAADRFEHARSHPLGPLWLRGRPPMRVRGTGDAGLAGVALAGGEVRAYLHPPEVLLRETLHARGIALTAGRHTRYAQGFVRRYGGIDDALQLIREHGAEIVRVLDAHDTRGAGLPSAAVAGHLARVAGLTQAAARGVLDAFLPRLLRSGLVRRGFGLRCPHCDLDDWYPLAAVREEVECGGCAQTFQLTSHQHIPFAYRPNELARRFLAAGGHAVLMTGAALARIEPSGALHFGGELRRAGDAAVLAEVDLLWISRGLLAIAECKSRRALYDGERRETWLRDVEQSLERATAAAVTIGARLVFLGVFTDDRGSAAELYALTAKMSEPARARNVGVHLILNGALHPFGSADAIEPLDQVAVGKLVLDATPADSRPVIGELPGSFGFGWLTRPLREEAVAAWEAHMRGT